MRPWLNATDNKGVGATCPTIRRSFNEAVAQRHGQRWLLLYLEASDLGFNEAVAQRHGQLEQLRKLHEWYGSASMRPWLNATDNLHEGEQVVRHAATASMRPWLNATDNVEHTAGRIISLSASMRPWLNATDNAVLIVWK